MVLFLAVALCFEKCYHLYRGSEINRFVRSVSAEQDEILLTLMGSDIRESQIVKFLNLVRETKKETMISVDYLVEEYLECSDYKQSVTTFVEHESPIRRYCAFEVIQQQFEIVDECWLRDGSYGMESKLFLLFMIVLL